MASTVEEAKTAVREMMEDHKFGASGNKVVIEECMVGPEVTVLAFCDGEHLVPMLSSQDHKRPMTAIRPQHRRYGRLLPLPQLHPRHRRGVHGKDLPAHMRAMNAEGRPFRGCLYFGLMLTKDGPKVIEYNCRFGDPETQVVLPLLKTDLLTVMQAVENETLGDLTVEWRNGAAACVILASGGYPGHYEKGKVITLPTSLPENVTIYHAGDTLTAEGHLVTSGGRVLGVTAVADTLVEALQDAYTTADAIDFEGKYLRRDIGRRALAAARN